MATSICAMEFAAGKGLMEEIRGYCAFEGYITIPKREYKCACMGGRPNYGPVQYWVP